MEKPNYIDSMIFFNVWSSSAHSQTKSTLSFIYILIIKKEDLNQIVYLSTKTRAGSKSAKKDLKIHIHMQF